MITCNSIYFLQELKFFLCANGCATLFMEEDRKQDLKRERKALLVEHLVLFILEKYTKATRSEIENVCKSAVQSNV